MSDWPAREERERFDEWAARVGVEVCDKCGALIRYVERHEKWHSHLLMAVAAPGVLLIAENS